MSLEGYEVNSTLGSHLTDTSVLVTGGAGFIGSHLAHALVPNANVTVFDDYSTGNPDHVPDNATFIQEDIRNRDSLTDAMSDIDVVFHQAGLVSVPSSISDPHDSHTRNATGTLNVLEAARRHDAKAIVASSAAVYGEPEYTPLDEAHPLDPESPYGLDKLTADYYTRLYDELYSLETVALRYFNVYGPGQHSGNYAGVITTFLTQARRGTDITVHGDGSQTRDFVHVKDIVQANIRAAISDVSGRSYNIGTGQSVTIRQLAELVREIADSNSEIIHTEPREGDVTESVVDISRAIDELDYEPTIGLQNGLRDLVGT